MHLSENEGIEGKTFVVSGGLGFVGSALCLELVRRGARLVKAFDLRSSSPWSNDLLKHGVHCIQGAFSDHPSSFYNLFAAILYPLEIHRHWESGFYQVSPFTFWVTFLLLLVNWSCSNSSHGICQTSSTFFLC